MRFSFLFSLALSFFLLPLLLAKGQQTNASKIKQAFEGFSRDEALAHASYSLTVLNVNSGEVVFASEPDRGLVPASTLKVITTVTGYQVLGPSFQYETRLGITGTLLPGGKLNGDLILIGSGDPSLGSSRFGKSSSEELLSRWVQAVQKAGITSVSGRVIGDDRLFQGNQAPDGWPWGDLGNYYGAGVSSLNWHENSVQVLFKSGERAGQPTQLLGVEPSRENLQLINEVLTGAPGTGDQVYAYSAPYSSAIYLRGTYGSDLKKKISISVPNPALHLAFALKDALQQQGVPTGEATTGYLLQNLGEEVPALHSLLDQYYSPGFSQLATPFNKVSINLFGEAFLKTCALTSQEEGDKKGAAEWMQEYWEKQIGVAKGALKLKDGSGLSPENRVTSLAMARVLAHAKKQSWFPVFYENLPVYNGMKMKSGTIGGVLGYAGYHTSSTGQSFAFVFLINNYQGTAPSMRQKMFKVLDSLK